MGISILKKLFDTVGISFSTAPAVPVKASKTGTISSGDRTDSPRQRLNESLAEFEHSALMHKPNAVTKNIFDNNYIVHQFTSDQRQRMIDEAAVKNRKSDSKKAQKAYSRRALTNFQYTYRDGEEPK